MKIPQSYQVFDTTVVISSKDEQRLAPYLLSWKHSLAPFINNINEPDLMRLAIMELLGKQRAHMLERLLGRLSREQRNRIEERIQKCLSPKKTRG